MKNHRENAFLLGILGALALGSSLRAQTQPPAKPQPKPQVPAASQVPGKISAKPAIAKQEPLQVPEIKFDKYKLDNGLEVILSEDHRLPMVAVKIWYNVVPAN